MLRFISDLQTNLKENLQSFRTLYVEVYLLKKLCSHLCFHCFRTLYVEVYHMASTTAVVIEKSFRTLYVEVYQ